jgi:acetylornithine/N-succinyldiaminopimelate aminotransferase
LFTFCPPGPEEREKEVLTRLRRFAVLEVLDREGLIEGAAAKGAYFLSRLEAMAARHPTLVKGARGRGLLCGLVLADHVEAREVLVALRDRGVLIAQAGDRVLRFAPPLIITEAELDEGLAALDGVLADMAKVSP